LACACTLRTVKIRCLLKTDVQGGWVAPYHLTKGPGVLVALRGPVFFLRVFELGLIALDQDGLALSPG